MNPLSEEILLAWEECEKGEKNNIEKLCAVPVDNEGLVVTNGAAFFVFEDAGSEELWQPLIEAAPDYIKHKIEQEGWMDMVGLKRRKLFSIEETNFTKAEQRTALKKGVPLDDLKVFEGEGERIYMGNDYFNLMWMIVDPPELKAQVPKDRGDLRYIVVVEGRIIRGAMGNRRFE